MVQYFIRTTHEIEINRQTDTEIISIKPRKFKFEKDQQVASISSMEPEALEPMLAAELRRRMHNVGEYADASTAVTPQGHASLASEGSSSQHDVHDDDDDISEGDMQALLALANKESASAPSAQAKRGRKSQTTSMVKNFASFLQKHDLSLEQVASVTGMDMTSDKSLRKYLKDNNMSLPGGMNQSTV